MGLKTITVKPTISAAVAYAAGDACGGILEFEDALSPFSTDVEIVNLVIVDDSQQSAAFKVALFDREFSPTDDNDPFNPSDADCENFVGWLDLAGAADYLYGQTQGLGMIDPSEVPLMYQAKDGETSIWAQLIVTTTPTFANADDLSVKLTVRT